jgi:hypothetical protein
MLVGEHPQLQRPAAESAGIRNGAKMHLFVMKGTKPWQDRRMLFRRASSMRRTASRRLAHGFQRPLETMRENPDV